MPNSDLNLLIALDALLSEGGVAPAAERIGLSESAMSRTLARLREATGDPLLVRAGRAMVPTPHATALRLRFAPKPDKDVRPLREGLLDLDIGVLGESGPEVRVQSLFRDRFVGVVRDGHPLLAGTSITPERYAACGHVVTSRRGQTEGPADDALATLGLARNAAVIVPSFNAALAIAAATDLVALIPSSYFEHLRARGTLRAFPLPMPTGEITVSQMWHPRLDADPAHRWLRGVVLETCRESGRD